MGDRGELKKIQLINGIEVQLGKAYCNLEGHELENKIKKHT